MEPRVSVIVAAYKPGDGFDRVIGSLDAQTLPQDEFELIVVDDGSPDDTFERLSALAATRPYMRVEQIENSGWPSRPRNVGTDLARAPYVLFMDHDDSLYPDALRRLVEYADEHGADVVNAKESQTRGIWWGTARSGTATSRTSCRVATSTKQHADDPAQALPQGVPRGARHPLPRGAAARCWEDIFFNVEAWRHAKVISLLADTPAYLWHRTEANNSSTYGPGGMEFSDPPRRALRLHRPHARRGGVRAGAPGRVPAPVALPGAEAVLEARGHGDGGAHAAHPAAGAVAAGALHPRRAGAAARHHHPPSL